jgi:cytochrome c-type biogenesis protein CcmF
MSGFLLILSFLSYKKNDTNINSNIVSILSVQLFSVLLSFLCLIYSFIISDFSNETVYNNSHTTKPIFYKISGAWGNHEGSLLLWLLVLTLFIFFFVFYSKKQPIKYRYLTIFFQQIIITGFFLFLIITSNPFSLLFPIPNEGLGLNPILQDPALAIHPPMLYLGYVGTSILFSSSLSSLVNNNVNSNWARHIKYWTLITWIFLTVGILLGSIWAYYELGWGGFWFWDPVENVSLIPWLCLTALLHTLNVLEKRNLLQSWTIILSIATFTFSMSGTFLVRSGILNSVHTFANDPERGIFILTFLFVLIILSLILFFIYQETEKSTEKKIHFLSKESSILVNNWFMMYFLSVVLIGTIYPIFLEVLASEKISIGPPFYNKLLIPFLIPFLIFMSIGPNFRWIKDNIKKINYFRIFLLIVSLMLSYFIIKNTSTSTLISTIFGGAAIYLFFTTAKDLFRKNYHIAQSISHFGFSLFILSVLFNSIFSYEFSANMKVGEEIKYKNGNIKFSKLNTFEKDNYKSLVASFEIINNEGSISMFPEVRIYNEPNILTSEADIITSMFADKFIVINLIKGEEIFNVRYQKKPFMIWIWISTLLIAIGGIVSLSRKKI